VLGGTYFTVSTSPSARGSFLCERSFALLEEGFLACFVKRMRRTLMRQKLDAARIRGLLDAERGLSSTEVASRRQRYGPNDIVEVAGHPFRELALETSRDPMIWFLVGTACLYLVLGSPTEATVLALALVPLVGMDLYLHRRTQASTSGLKQRLAERALVLRDEQWTDVAAVDLVPGDLVRVKSGDSFPADGVVVAAEEVQVDESSLTGEAYPVRKRALFRSPTSSSPPEENEPLVEGVHWGFAGTRVLTGKVSLRVVSTGGQTLYGSIVRSATLGSRAPTPLQRAVASLVRELLAAAGALCVILAAVRLRQGHGLLDAIVSAATLAVAALPEEFPVVLTVFLGTGVYRLARRHALVRRAVSVENIGRATCICSDKTGTITEGRLRLDAVVPHGTVSPEQLLTLSAVASRAEQGDPLDEAILERAAGRSLGDEEYRLLASFPFTEQRRRETAVVGKKGTRLAVSKGSPELMLELVTLDVPDRESFRSRIDALASGGRKVIACATRELDAGWSGEEPNDGFELVGALSFEDPVREGVPEAVRICQESGIRVLMTTGDHPDTARFVATEIGLGDGSPRVLSGEQLEGFANLPLAKRLEQVDVIARSMPSDKLALVRALQTSGEIVVVTGDGVNDVPALQAADVGIAMGERGTRSAREVASIVLLDDDFSSIVRAIAEGRQLFRNLQQSFRYLLMFHVPLVLTATFIPLAGYPLLYLPIHIVLLEAIIHPTALLAFSEPALDGRLAPTDRRGTERFFDRLDWLEIALAGALATLLVAAGYVRSLGTTMDVEHARAMALVALASFGGSLTALLSRLRTRTATVLCLAGLAVTLLAVQLPPLAERIHLRPLHLDDWAVAIAGGILVASLPRLLVALVRRWRAHGAKRRKPWTARSRRVDEDEPIHTSESRVGPSREGR
jgi:Ca2+-transporting ATPase